MLRFSAALVKAIEPVSGRYNCFAIVVSAGPIARQQPFSHPFWDHSAVPEKVE